MPRPRVPVSNKRVASHVLRSAVGFVAYVLAGYPAVMTLLARIRPRPVRRDDVTPTVTMIVPCFNEADVIGAKIANLQLLDYPADLLEIVVVDDGSDDSTGDTARHAAQAPGHAITVLEHAHRRGKAEALNTAHASTSGEIIVLSDATAIWDRDALRQLVRAFADADVGVVSGRMQYRANATGGAMNLYWRYEDRLRTAESASGSTVGVNGNVFAIRRVDFHPLSANVVNDEATLALRAASAGRRVVFEPAALAVDVPSPSVRVERQRRARITAGRLRSSFGPARTVWKRPGLAFRFASHKMARPLLPAAGMLAILAATSVVTRPSRAHAIFDRVLAWAIVSGTAGVAVAAWAGWSRERRSLAVPLPLRLSHLVVASCAASVSGLARALRGRQAAQWTKRPPEPFAGN